MTENMTGRSKGGITQFLINKGFIAQTQHDVPFYRVFDLDNAIKDNILGFSYEGYNDDKYSDVSPVSTVIFEKPRLTRKGFRAVEIGLSAIAIAEMLLLAGLQIIH